MTLTDEETRPTAEVDEMAGPAELEMAVASVDASTARVKALLGELQHALDDQAAAAHRLLDVAGRRPEPIEPEAILQAIALDDEMMADLDAILTMDTAAIAAAVRELPRGALPDVDGLAQSAVLRTYQEILAEMERRGAGEARDILADRGDVYRHLIAAATLIASRQREQAAEMAPPERPGQSSEALSGAAERVAR